jgi:DNA-binding SARP family transcriptional activator
MRGIYKLQLSAFFGQNIWYDTHLFAEEYQKAQFFLQNNEYDEAKQALKAMVVLYRGDYLTSIYSDWCRYIREELQRNYIYVCLQLAYFAFQEKDFDKCIDYSQRILLYDKYNEDAYYVLISCYVMQEKKRQAYNYYLQCKQTLQEDLDIEPNGSIKSLYHKYIRHGSK